MRSRSSTVTLLIERAFLDAFGEQFADMAARVVNHAALGNSRAAVQLVALHQRAARGVHFDFKRDAQLAAVAEHGVVRGGQSRGPGVEVVALLEGAGLARAVGKVHLRPVANAPVPAAGPLARFKNRARPSRFAQLVGRNQPRNAPAENHHARAFAVDEAQRDGFASRFGNGQQARATASGRRRRRIRPSARLASRNSRRVRLILFAFLEIGAWKQGTG